MISASVFSESCFIADAYATAFMALGFEKSMEVLSNNDQIGAVFLYRNKENTIKVFVSDNIIKKVVLYE